MRGAKQLTSIPGCEHCKSSVTRWKISRRKMMHTIKAGRKYLRGFLGRLVRLSFNGASSSSGDGQQRVLSWARGCIWY